MHSAQGRLNCSKYGPKNAVKFIDNHFLECSTQISDRYVHKK